MARDLNLLSSPPRYWAVWISTAGKVSWGGAVFSSLLVGLMRFGMGLLNIQGQVQGIAIGLLLIFSILIPSLVRSISTVRKNLNWRSTFFPLIFLIIFVLF